VASVGMGCFSAFVLVCFLFQEIHLIALVFGASLIGVAIDYSLHFVSKLQINDPAQFTSVLKQLILPMTLGLGTTLLGYACLFQSDLKVLNEIAVFSMMGLLVSWLCVCVVYPVYFKKSLPVQSLYIRFISNLPARFWQNKIFAVTAVVVLSLLVCLGFYRFTLSDEVRTFYKPPANLLASEQYLQKKLNNISLHQYLLLRAPDTESLLQLEESVRQSLDQLVVNGDLGSYLALSQQVPSIKMQIANRQLLEEHVYQEGALLDQLRVNLDLDDEFAVKARKIFATSRDFLQVNDWIGYARPDQKILWVGNVDNEVASIIVFKSINNLQSLHSLSNEHSILFVDKVDSISNAIDQLTSQAIQWLQVSYLLISLLLVIYFRRLSVLVLPSVPLAATLLALVVLSCFSMPINLFHIFGCYLILGFGIDYAIFYFFDQKKDSATEYGTFLAAMTSIMSFGFLAFSSTPMVQSFGLILLLGCTFSLLISPLASQFNKQGRL
jgi:predicted exporter